MPGAGRFRGPAYRDGPSRLNDSVLAKYGVSRCALGAVGSVRAHGAARDGEHTYLTVKFPIPDGRGGISGIAAIGTDITERKRVEEEIAEKSTLLETTSENMSQGICVFDADM